MQPNKCFFEREAEKWNAALVKLILFLINYDWHSRDAIATHTTWIWWNKQLRYFAGMNTETMQQCSTVQIPKTYSKVNATRQQMRFVISERKKQISQWPFPISCKFSEKKCIKWHTKVETYLGWAKEGHSKQLTRPRCADKIWWAGQSNSNEK